MERPDQEATFGDWLVHLLDRRMKECAHFIADHGIEIDRIFSDTWSVDDAARAYELFDQQAGGKGVFTF